MKGALKRADAQVAVLDLEASGFAHGSYPIEVGIAMVRGGSAIVSNWAALVRPTQLWMDVGLWSEQSAAVHGISFETLLEAGRAPADVCDWLNALLGFKTLVVSDAPMYDQDWLNTLFRAAGREQLFTLHSFEVATVDFVADQHRQLRHLLRRAPIPHRAGADALRLAAALLEVHLGCPAIVDVRGDPFDTR